MRWSKRDASFAANFGTGQRYGVMDAKALKKGARWPVPYDIMARRPGDVTSCFADPAAGEKIID